MVNPSLEPLVSRKSLRLLCKVQQDYKYASLTRKQQEIFNFQKAASILADYGFKVIKLSDDWNGANFIAQHFNTDSFLKVQLKGRWALDKKYYQIPLDSRSRYNPAAPPLNPRRRPIDRLVLRDDDVRMEMLLRRFPSRLPHCHAQLFRSPQLHRIRGHGLHVPDRRQETADQMLDYLRDAA